MDENVNETRGTVALIAHHRPVRLGALVAEVLGGLYAAALPPMVIVSRRHPEDDLHDGDVLYIGGPEGTDRMLGLAEVKYSRNVLAGHPLVIDDPWADALHMTHPQLAERIMQDSQRTLLGMLGAGAKRPGSRAYAPMLARRGRLADGACSYRPTGTKRTRRRAMGKAYGQFCKRVARFGSLGVYGQGSDDVEMVTKTVVSAATVRSWGSRHGQR